MKMKITKSNLIMAGIVILLLFLLKCSHDSNNNLEADLVLKNYNLEAMKDSAETVTLKYGEISTQKKSLVTSLEDLEKYNDSLANRVKYLKKELDVKPITYVKWKTRIVHDTTYIDSKVTRIDTNKFLVTFKKDTVYSEGNSRFLSGRLYLNVNGDKLHVGGFTIDRDEMVLDAEIVFSEKDEEIVVNVISSHPGFNAEQIESVVLDPKLHPELKKLNNKRFILGPYVGLGFGLDGTIKPQVGVGLTYKIIGFK